MHIKDERHKQKQLLQKQMRQRVRGLSNLLTVPDLRNCISVAQVGSGSYTGSAVSFSRMG